MGVKHNVLNARHHEQRGSDHRCKAAVWARSPSPPTWPAAAPTFILGGNIEFRMAWEELKQKYASRLDVPRLSGTNSPKKSPAMKAWNPKREEGAGEAGGLHVVGSGTARIPPHRQLQLRGRSGRQGDPGASLFFLSLEDDLMRIFGSEKMDTMLSKLGLKDGEAIVHPWINKALEKAQQKVEARNYEIRKNLLKFDDVMNDQRSVVLRAAQGPDAHRRRLGDGQRHAPRGGREHRRRPHPGESLSRAMGPGRHARFMPSPARHRPADQGLGQGGGHRRRGDPRAHYQGSGYPRCRQARHLRQRGLAPRGEEPAAADPRSELEGPPAHPRPPAPGHRPQGLRSARPAQRVQGRGLRDVRDMLASLREQTTQLLSHVELRIAGPEEEESPVPERRAPKMQETRRDPALAGAAAGAGARAGAFADNAPPPARRRALAVRRPRAVRARRDRRQRQAARFGALPSTRETRRPGAESARNAPCPCGSGLKFKRCHGKLA